MSYNMQLGLLLIAYSMPIVFGIIGLFTLIVKILMRIFSSYEASTSDKP